MRMPVISAFIIFHWVLNFVYLFNNHPYMNNVVATFWPYYSYFGLDQNWGVFAPHPREANPHLTAIIHYKDGSSRLWAYPRMERLSFLERIPKERFRKFFDDNAAWPKFDILWPDIAAYIARLNYRDQNNPPELVTLVRFHSFILPPAEGMGKKNPPHWETNAILTYNVKSEDLQDLKPTGEAK